MRIDLKYLSLVGILLFKINNCICSQKVDDYNYRYLHLSQSILFDSRLEHFNIRFLETDFYIEGNLNSYYSNSNFRTYETRLKRNDEVYWHNNLSFNLAKQKFGYVIKMDAGNFYSIILKDTNCFYGPNSVLPLIPINSDGVVDFPRSEIDNYGSGIVILIVKFMTVTYSVGLIFEKMNLIKILQHKGRINYALYKQGKYK